MPTKILPTDAKSILAEIQMIDAEANKKKASKIATLQATRAELVRQIAMIDEVLGSSAAPAAKKRGRPAKLATAPTAAKQLGKKRGRPAKSEKTQPAKTQRAARLTTEEIGEHSEQIKKLLVMGPLSLGGISEGIKLPKSSTRTVIKSLGKAVKMEGTRAAAKYVLVAK